MLRKHASVVIAFSLIALVTTACIVRTTNRRAQPVYVEKHKEPKKHKENRGKHKGNDNHQGNQD